MKRIEVKLNVEAVAPLLDLIKAAAGDLAGRLAVPQQLQDLDEELRAGWRDELLGGQNDDCRRFLALFDRDFFAGGVVGFDETNAEPALRACAAIRLRLRARELRHLPDEMLEGGPLDINQFEPPVQKAFMCYVFLATLQELIIQHLDSALLDG
jgi:hypothetical protein